MSNEAITIISVLLAIVVLETIAIIIINNSAGWHQGHGISQANYYRGKYEELTDNNGWQDEAMFWRRHFNPEAAKEPETKEKQNA